ncbi:MAG: SulP family inorganic anion transporter, partial [Ferruginibacter sp.]
LLGIEAVDKMDPLKRVTPTNRELIAQGTGNMVSGLLGGLPLTSVIVRSSANTNAGAKTKASTILHGILIFVCVAFLPQLLNLIPKAALAAILVFTGYKLVKLSIFKEQYKKGWDQFMPFVVTLLAIVLTDLLKGVIIGLGVGLFYVIRSNFRTAIMVINDNNNYMIRLRKDVSFFSKPDLKSKLEKIPADATLMIDVTRAEFIDKDIIETINDFIKHAHLKRIRVTVNKSIYNRSSQVLETEIKLHEQIIYNDQAS